MRTNPSDNRWRAAPMYCPVIDRALPTGAILHEDRAQAISGDSGNVRPHRAPLGKAAISAIPRSFGTPAKPAHSARTVAHHTSCLRRTRRTGFPR